MVAEQGARPVVGDLPILGWEASRVFDATGIRAIEKAGGELLNWESNHVEIQLSRRQDTQEGPHREAGHRGRRDHQHAGAQAPLFHSHFRRHEKPVRADRPGLPAEGPRPRAGRAAGRFLRVPPPPDRHERDGRHLHRPVRPAFRALLRPRGRKVRVPAEHGHGEHGYRGAGRRRRPGGEGRPGGHRDGAHRRRQGPWQHGLPGRWATRGAPA